MSQPPIHQTATVDPTAELGNDVTVGAYAEIGPGCIIGDGSTIQRGAVIIEGTSLGKECRVGHYSIIGGDAQDLKYSGEKTRLTIGDRTDIREYVTINRGTVEGGAATTIGDDCLMMSYVHIAHDAKIGNNVVISGMTGMAGHVTIQDYARLGGGAKIHQFCSVGRYAHVGLGSVLLSDVPAYFLVTGNPARAVGINVVLLERSNFADQTLKAIKRAFQVVCIEPRTRANRIDKLRRLAENTPEISDICQDLEQSSRGIVRPSGRQ